MPPERGNSAASSAYVSAPHSVTAPPSTQLSRNNGTSSTRCAIDAGVRKMPLPIVEPTTTATALHKPRRSEEHTSELQSPCNLVCRLLLEKKKVATGRGLVSG